MKTNDWRKEDLIKLKNSLSEWEKNEGNMQNSYPYGLPQYLEESNYLYGSLCDLIAEMYNQLKNH